MRDAVLFYRSFSDAVKALPEGEQLAALWAMIDYGLDGTEPESGIARSMWLMAKPLIDRNNQRYENGKRGGRPKKEPTENQTVTETKPKQNQAQTKKSQRDMLDSLLAGRAVNKEMREALGEWVDYKAKERREPYKEIGMKSLITQAVNNGARYGAEAVVNAIRQAIANQYKGIVWDRLERPRAAAKFNNAPERTYEMDDLERRLLVTN